MKDFLTIHYSSFNEISPVIERPYSLPNIGKLSNWVRTYLDTNQQSYLVVRPYFNWCLISRLIDYYWGIGHSIIWPSNERDGKNIDLMVKTQNGFVLRTVREDQFLKNRWFKVSLTKFLNLYDAKTLYRHGKVYYLSRHKSLDKDMHVFWVRALVQTICYSRVVNSFPSKLMYMVLRLEVHEKDHLKFTKI